jgi:uncharacterized protein (UPF0303 family)
LAKRASLDIRFDILKGHGQNFGAAMETKNDLELIARQERELSLPQFDEGIAWEIGLQIRELAVSRHLPVAIEVRRQGQLIFYSALEGATPDNAEWVRRKSNLVARFQRSSYAIGLDLSESKATLSEKFELSGADHAAHGGSFPLRVTTAGYVGSVTVSGLPQRADHELVVEALCLHLGHDYQRLKLKNP